eukprot:13497825-Ditylum_brightwellii.AAC.1
MEKGRMVCSMLFLTANVSNSMSFSSRQQLTPPSQSNIMPPPSKISIHERMQQDRDACFDTR